jgi:2-iminobutanoate/2-iminopropanoate deaminase
LTVKVVKTEKAPSPVGPYSQGFIVEGFVFTAGQVGINPETGEVAEDVAEQTRQALENIRAILEAAGTSMNNLIKTTIFLADIAYFKEVNNVYATYFRGDPPARTTVQAKPALDIFKVEIEAIAYMNR